MYSAEVRLGLRERGAGGASAVEPGEGVHRPDGHGALAFLPSTDSTDSRASLQRECSTGLLACCRDALCEYCREQIRRSTGLVLAFRIPTGKYFGSSSFHVHSTELISVCNVFFIGWLGFEPEAGDCVLGKAEGAVRGEDWQALLRDS